MKIPISWLKDYVTFDATPEELASRLTFSGLAVEGMETVGARCEGIQSDTSSSELTASPDVVLDLEVTWNRPDCLGIIGVAREIAALFHGELRMPSVEFPESEESVNAFASVSVEDPAGCSRYTARVFSGVKPGPSPAWMQRRLSICGLRPINNVVDATNYVMLECGQPLHAFDCDLLSGRAIVARRAEAGERIVTLDGMERKLSPDVLVIADSRKPVAIAGVMGAAGSEIGPNTVRILLESACFSAPLVRMASSALGLKTESSYRFERGVDLLGVDWAGRRAAALLCEYSGAIAARGAIDVFPHKPAGRRVKYRFNRAQDLLGVHIPNETAVSIMESLGLSVVDRNDAACAALVPTFRMDIEIEADLIEEVARIYGLDKLPAAPPRARVVSEADDTRARAVLSCRNKLVGLGLSEILNYSFVSEPLLDEFLGEDAEHRVILPNPVSSDHAALRSSLLPQMVETLARNVSRQVVEAAFFEIGKVFFRDGNGKTCEEERVAIGLMGKAGCVGPGGTGPARHEDVFLWLKGIVEALSDALHAGGERHKLETVSEKKREAGLTFAPVRHPALEDGCSVGIEMGGNAAGVMGLVRRAVRTRRRMAEPTAVAEIAIASLINRAFEIPAARIPPPYPSVTRDFAIVLSEDITHDDVLKTLWKIAPKELTQVRLFDIFRNKQIGEGHKSLAYSLVYRSSDRTLTDDDANTYHNSIKEALKNELGAVIRDG